MASSISGVYPVLATPFAPDLSPDRAGLRAIVNYAIAAGADGVVYPGVASEYDTLATDERLGLVETVASASRDRVPLIVGASATDPSHTIALIEHARATKAAAVMVMAPKALTNAPDVVTFFSRIAQVGVPIMLQNAPPPAGSGLPVEIVLEVTRSVRQIAYVKEEALPSGARIARLRAEAPPTLLGIFGGAGGRYITDELARGAVGTMPAAELVELHVALFRAHRAVDRPQVRRWFNRMLPILNMQAVFRWALTKEVLRRRGIIECAAKRAPGPELDAGDHAELAELLAELADVLAPPVMRPAP